ncbi:hypothetical protein DLAC_07097 [Tieghemostelium lacteum]|uniref:DNA mismatch repair proteins mutS family domain-containing protein n=1 Tax=Tieghemostelium lacteum TaxID=361077 RepID=A0A151ZEB3_TIELA|nr:hypothetical protein DLAC_07097 [Tieghemostelium lacteum]|eukprot:KYQ92250.1 hypothetical protein DLAC_07097 [Tieghemostelium lacteum]
MNNSSKGLQQHQKTPILWIDNELPPSNLLKSIDHSVNSNRKVIGSTPTSSIIQNNQNEDICIGSDVIMSVIYYKLKIGIAYFDKQLSIIHLCETWEDENFNCLSLLKQQNCPKVIIIPSRMPQKFIDSVYKKDGYSDFQVHISKTSDFNSQVGRNRLLNLKLPCFQYTTSAMDSLKRLQFLESYINFDQHEMMKALGGLLSYLSKYLMLDEFDTLESLNVNEIRQFSFDHFLQLDLNTLYSLHIFSQETHPSIYSLGNSKEGLSVFGIMDRTKTPMGKRMLKSWFMRPSRKVSVIEQRQSLIGILGSNENHPLKMELLDILSHVKDVQIILGRIKLNQNPQQDFISIHQTLNYLLRLKIALTNQNCRTNEFLSRIYSLFPESLSRLLHHMESVFDFSQENDELVSIKEGVDSQLDNLMAVYSDMNNILTQQCEEEKSKFSDISWLTTFYFVYYPQLGCMISIPKNPKVPLATQKSIPNLKFVFQTSGFIYFQNEKTLHLDEYFGDIHNDILDIKSRIEREIINEILDNRLHLLELIGFCAELDCLISLAIVCKNLDFKKPTISMEPSTIHIVNGRHPLQEMCVPSFIPNDTALYPKKPIYLLSGPNQSGKSIYLKQVAIIVFLTHLGCFVPADSANISLCDRIFTRLSSRESNSVLESSFMIDCKQISQITKFSTSNSLLIIDEFGKGTNPQDGISLLYGLLNYMSSLDHPPMALVSTHFYEIFDLLTISKTVFEHISFCSMEFLIKDNHHSSTKSGISDLDSYVDGTNQQEKSMDRNDIILSNFTPLYKLKEGISSSSFGLHCAKNAGIANDVLSRANQIIEHQKNNKKIDTNTLNRIPENEKKLARYTTIFKAFEIFDPNQHSIQSLLDIIKNKKE